MHLALKSAMSRIPYTNKVGETLSSIADPAAAYSLRALGGGDSMVARVRRSSDDTEKDFTASDMGAALEDWVNEDVVTYQSDFSSGTDGWGGSGDEDGVSVSQSSAGIGGQSNTIIATLDSTNGVHSFWDDLDRYNGTGLFKIKFDVYIPSNQDINGVQLLVYSEGSNAFQPILNPTLDSWNTYESNEFIRTAADSNRIFFYLTGENGRVFTGNGTDFAHFKNIEITQLTADGHVVTWYDQSGNGNNATQSTAGSQPKIVDAGVYLGELEFDGVDDRLTGAHNITSTYTICSVQDDDASSGSYILDTGPASNYGVNYGRTTGSQGSRILTLNHGGSPAVNAIGFLPSTTFLLTQTYNSTTIEAYVDGGSVGTDDQGYIASGTNLTIGSSGDGGARFNGSISEIVIYNSDQSSNRAAIETNINNHYDIY